LLLQTATRLMSWGVQAADRLGVPARLTGLVLSGIFNVMYWQGACDELGGRARLLEALADGARMTAKPSLVGGDAPVLGNG
jgi:hypothetical protein